MSKNFQEQAQELGLIGNTREIRRFLEGKTLEIVANSGGHNYGEVGHRFKITNTGGVGGSYLVSGIPGGNTMYYYEFRVIVAETADDLKKSIESLRERQEEIETEILETESKIKFIEENGLNRFNEDEFKIFQTLKTLEDKEIPSIDKARAIAKLMRG